MQMSSLLNCFILYNRCLVLLMSIFSERGMADETLVNEGHQKNLSIVTFDKFCLFLRI